MTGPEPDGGHPPIILHGSLPVILNAYLSPVALIVLAVWVALTRRPSVAALVIGAIGCLLAFVALFDMPLRTEFSSGGITRVCALRRHHIPWSRVIGIERAPTRSAMRYARRPDQGGKPGGLVARVGRRRYMLVNRPEGALQYDRLVVAVRSWDDVVVVRARRPPATTVPTDLHRRGGGGDDADPHG